jgi:hypothetical protein
MLALLDEEGGTTLKQITPFYTVVESPSGRFTVRYATPPDWTVCEMGRNYDDPAEAINEFKKYERFQTHAKLTKIAFDRRVRHHEQDVQKLSSWRGDF